MKEEENWDLIIKSKRSFWKVDLMAIWEHRDLLMMFVKRDIMAVYKQTILGPIWFLIQPLFTMAIYTFVFGNLAGLSTAGLPKPVFYLTGITFWTYFSQTLIGTSTILKTNAKILGKVYFPRMIMPLSLVISNLFKLGIQFFLLVIVIFYFSLNGFSWTPSEYLLILPILILILIIQALGFGMLVSALTTKYRDLALLLAFGIQLIMYMAPIVYPLDSLSGTMYNIVSMNPVTPIFEGIRMALYGQGTFVWFDLFQLSGISFFILLVGVLVFNKVERDFVDTI
jgi:lipopolysaccharide transport system permease protein